MTTETHVTVSGVVEYVQNESDGSALVAVRVKQSDMPEWWPTGEPAQVVLPRPEWMDEQP